MLKILVLLKKIYITMNNLVLLKNTNNLVEKTIGAWEIKDGVLIGE